MSSFFPELLLFAAVSAFTPGPNNIMIMSSGLNFGWRASLPHLFGICLGFPAMLVAIALGAAGLFLQFPWLHTLIKVVGILYLVYLAWRIAMSSQQNEGRASSALSFWQAAMFQWVNPKAWVMGVSALATFTSLTGDVWQEMAVVIVVFAAFTWPSAGCWLFFGTKLKSFLARPSRRKAFNVTMATLLLFSVVPVVGELKQALLG